jgi:hypothetical protein
MFALKEEHMQMCENKVIANIFEPKKDEVN